MPAGVETLNTGVGHRVPKSPGAQLLDFLKISPKDFFLLSLQNGIKGK